MTEVSARAAGAVDVILGGLGDPLGFAVYAYRIAQAMAAMAVALGGISALAFSGGVGEKRQDVRQRSPRGCGSSATPKSRSSPPVRTSLSHVPCEACWPLDAAIRSFPQPMPGL